MSELNSAARPLASRSGRRARVGTGCRMAVGGIESVRSTEVLTLQGAFAIAEEAATFAAVGNLLVVDLVLHRISRCCCR